jgi:hypothetical protein
LFLHLALSGSMLLDLDLGGDLQHDWVLESTLGGGLGDVEHGGGGNGSKTLIGMNEIEHIWGTSAPGAGAGGALCADFLLCGMIYLSDDIRCGFLYMWERMIREVIDITGIVRSMMGVETSTE